MLCYTMLGSIKQERQYLEVVQSKSWRETRRGVVGIRSNGKVEVVSIYRDIRRFIYRFDGIFFCTTTKGFERETI